MIDEHFEIVFLGAPRAGKSTLMAAWHELAKSVYGAQPDLDYEQTHEFIKGYERWRNGESVNPTARGEQTKARFACSKNGRKFHLVLHDFSGEDIVHFLENAAPGEDYQIDSRVESGLREVIDTANWIVQVCDPKRLVHGSAEDQNNALALSKLLPQVVDGRHTFGDITNGYFSNADSVDAEIVDQAKSMIDGYPSLNYLGKFHSGCSLYSATNEGEENNPLQAFFNQTMTEVLSNVSLGNRGASERWNSKFLSKVIAFGFLTLIAAVVALWVSKPPLKSPWNRFRSSFDQLKRRASEVSTFSPARRLLKEFDEWETDVEGEIGNEEVKLGFKAISSELAEVKAGLEKFCPPNGTEKIEALLVKKLVENAGRIDLFYRDLKKVAADNCKDDKSWNKDAIENWKDIFFFAERVCSDGLQVTIGNCWVKGPQWWTSYVFAYDDLRAEFWIAPSGAPCPFDKYTSGENPARLLEMGWRNPVSHGEGQYSVSWPKQEHEISLSLSDQIWIRVLESQGDNETWISAKVKRSGPRGLDWFNKTQTCEAIDGESDYQLNISLDPLDPDVPPAVFNAFRSYESGQQKVSGVQ